MPGNLNSRRGWLAQHVSRPQDNVGSDLRFYRVENAWLVGQIPNPPLDTMRRNDVRGISSRLEFRQHHIDFPLAAIQGLIGEKAVVSAIPVLTVKLVVRFRKHPIASNHGHGVILRRTKLGGLLMLSTPGSHRK
jgi:hypothetical protein